MAHKCITTGFTIPGDTKGVFSDLVIAHAGGSFNKAYTFAAYLSEPEFIAQIHEYSLNKKGTRYKGDGTLNKLDKNDVKHMLNERFKQDKKAILNSVAARNNDALMGFTSARAKFEAIEHTANRIIEIYHGNMYLPKDKRQDNNAIINQIIKEAEQQYLNNIVKPLLAKIESTDSELYNKVREAEKAVNDILASGRQLSAVAKDLQKKENKTTEDNLRAKDVNDEIIKLNKKLKDAKLDRYLAYKEVVREHGNSRELNFANFYYQTRSADKGIWFRKAFQSAKLVNIVKEFNSTLESDAMTNGNELDEADLENMDSETDGVNKMTANWADSLNASFEQGVATDLKLYFNTLYKLDKPVAVGEEPTYDTENELGVPMTMGANFVITQILNYGDFSSPKAFIQSLQKASQRVDSLAGLSVLVNKMITEPLFANRVFDELGDPKVRKVIANISETGFEFTQSNRSTDAVGFMIFGMLNSFKNQYTDRFDASDLQELNNISRYVNKKTLTHFEERDETIQAVKYIKDYLFKYFPNLDEKAINAALFNGSDYRASFAEFVSQLVQFQKDIKEIVDKYNSSIAEYNRAIYQYEQEKTNANNMGMSFTKPRPVFDNNTLDFKSIYSSLIPIARRLAKYTATKNELNTVNAEGNLASDIIKNNYISNIIKQIQHGTDEEINQGLERIKDFIIQGHQYDYSPIFFGVTDSTGREIVPGLFRRQLKGDNTTITINPNAKLLLSYALFDGTKDSMSDKAVMYNQMSKGDYFMTNLIAFFNPTMTTELMESDSKNGMNVDDFASFFMRTPSDAPKNFIVQAPKYKIQGLWSTDKNSSLAYVGRKKNAINALIENPANDDAWGFEIHNARGNKVEPLTDLKTPKANKYSAEDIYDLINAHLNGEELDNINYSSMTYEELEDGSIHIPLIYQDSEKKEGFIVHVTGDKIVGESSDIITNVKVEAITTTGRKALNSFYEEVEDKIIEEGVNTNEIQRNTNRDNAIFRGFATHLYNELNTFVDQLSNIFVFNKETGKWTSRDDIDNLIDRAHYNGNSVLTTYKDKDGKEHLKLSGNFFKFVKLFESSGYNVNDALDDALSLYGGGGSLFIEENGHLVLNTDRLSNADNKEDILIDDSAKLASSTARFSLNKSRKIRNAINAITEQWVNSFGQEIYNRTKQYSAILESMPKEDRYTQEQIYEAMFNAALMEMSFDDLFEGDSKFYKDAQDFLKRAKEVQAGGKSYANYDLNDTIGGDLYDITDFNGQVQEIKIGGKPYSLPRRENGKYIESTMKARNGFRAVTIYNTINSIEAAPRMRDELEEIYIKKGIEPKRAREMANTVAAGYFKTEALNDAQSYITLDEFIARRYADGTLDQYQDLLTQLLDDNIPVEQIDLEKINARIQVQKNFYYDKQYDPRTRTYYPRQIKNAEFVLIPKLIKGTDLETLYDIMKSHDIGQLNTAETSKAAKKNTVTFWDNDGVAHPEDFIAAIEKDNENAIENYYYRYLYKQQDVPEHMKDAKNKAGIQIIKKLIDNSDESTRPYIEDFFKTYVSNIEEDFDTLLANMGWVYEDGKLMNANPDNRYNEDGTLKTIKFEEFYDKALIEAQRLGLDDNILDYLQPDDSGFPIMPNYMNLRAAKLESIAQAIFNSAITRQTLPGWHGAQVTGIGHGQKVRTIDGKMKSLRYHPAIYELNGRTIEQEEYDALSKEEQSKWNIKVEPYMEILVPRWSKLIPKGKTAAENEAIFKQIQEEGLDLHIGYRIPTEGKQSVSIMKVVGFLDDVYGSTIMVPDAWVTQTGSDFDVDSIYGISYTMYKDKNNKLHKVEFDEDMSAVGVRRRYINYINNLLEKKVKAGSANNTKAHQQIQEAWKEVQGEMRLKHKGKIAEVHAQSNALFKKLKAINSDFKTEIITESKIQREPDEFYKRYDNFADICAKYADATTDEALKEDYNELHDIYINISKAVKGTEESQAAEREEFLSKFRSKKANIYIEIAEELKEEQLETIEIKAADNHLVSYEEFKSWDIMKQNSRAARNNRILDNMIKIMSAENSREENYSRSNFDDISDSIERYNNMAGYKIASRSPYNPLDQIDFMENAMSGAQIKAFSVTRDTFNSVNNHIKSYLGETHGVDVIYDTTLPLVDKNGEIIKDENENIIYPYKVQNAIDAYGKENVTMYDKNGEYTTHEEEAVKFKVHHERFANSLNNRNVVGKLITPYSSQTTAHILDAIKTGAIINENDYTFGTFKTLVDIGIDYDTAISWLMQPGITEIVNINNETKSIYAGSGGNPIRNAVKRVAARAGITINGQPITDYSIFDKVVKEVSNNSEFQAAFRKLFNIDVNELKTFMDIPFMLERGQLEARLKHDGVLSEDPHEDKILKAAYDLAVISMFNKIHETSEHIGTIARCSNPDRFGAKQTIRATKQVLDDIETYSDIESENSHPAAHVLMVDPTTNILNALYPGFKNGRNIDITKSKYPYLAAFLKYATIPSVEANKELFVTENEKYTNIVNAVQQKLGIRFTDLQYREYKQYMMNDVYNSCPTLMTPLMIDSHGRFVPNTELMEEYAANNADYQTQERNRIFGYEQYQNINIDFNDINNPNSETDKENLKAFYRLTPAQKVLFIQYNFKDGRGIFEYLNVNLFNQFEFKRKGYSSESIKFNDSIENMSEIYQLFLDSFHNKNELIRSAAADLIKYSFIAEGFRFKKGSISKLIANSAMYSTKADMGLGLIDEVKNQFSRYVDPMESISDPFMERFIRSHSEIVRTVRLPKNSKNGRDNNVADVFAKNVARNTSGIIQLDFNKTNQDLLDLIGIQSKDSPRDYVKVDRFIGKKREITLYKIRKEENAIYLYPLNLLERDETSEVSANNKNNKFPAADFYTNLIDAAMENNSTIAEYSEKNGEIIKKQRANFTIKAHKYHATVAASEDITYLENLRKNGNQKQIDVINEFINKIDAHYLSQPIEEKEGADWAVIPMNGNTLVMNFPRNKTIYQKVNVNGEEVTIAITRYNGSRGLKQHKADLLGRTPKVMAELLPQEKYAYSQLKSTGLPHTPLYKVERVVDADVKEDFENAKKEADDATADDMKSITSTLGGINVNTNVEFIDSDRVAKHMLNEINKRANANAENPSMKDKAAIEAVKRFRVNHIDHFSSQSIHDNRRNIYNTAAEYFSSLGNSLLQRINHFTTQEYEDENGNLVTREFALNDKELYKYLRSHPEDYALIVSTILEAKTFGDVFYDIMNLDIQGEDEETQRSITAIRNIINDVRNNSALKAAIELLFNDYIANEYSTNPMIREGFIELRTQFGDVDWFDLNFSGIGELSHKQIQTVTKYVYAILNEATQLTAPKMANEFTKKFDSILADTNTGSFDWSHIVTDEGKFINPYNQQWIDDRQHHIDEVKRLREENPDSIEYYRAKLAKDKWFAENTEQVMVKDYYDSMNAITDEVLRFAPNEYVEYMKLQHDLYSKTTNPDEANETEISRRKRIRKQINELLSDTTSTGAVKSEDARTRIDYLRKYIKAKAKINDKYFEYKERAGFNETLERYSKYIAKYDREHYEDDLDTKLTNERYKQAYDWIHNNAYYDMGLDDEYRTEYQLALETLGDNSNSRSKAIRKFIASKDAYDEYGNIDPSKLTKDDIQHIHDLMTNKVTGMLNINNSLLGESQLLKLTSKDNAMLTTAFWDSLRDSSEKSKDVNVQRLKIIGEINRTLYKAIDIHTGQFDISNLLDLSSEDKDFLIAAYKALHKIKGNRNNKELAKKFKANVNMAVDWAAFNEAMAIVKTKYSGTGEVGKKGNPQYEQAIDLLVQHDKNGKRKTVMRNGKAVYVPNQDLFGYTTPKNSKYVDRHKQQAINFLNANFEDVVTDKYYDAIKEATDRGEFEEWFHMNHVYDQRNHKWKPLPIWTTTQVRPGSGAALNAKPGYYANFENRDRFIREKNEAGERVNYYNPNYTENGENYRNGNPSYATTNSLTQKERNMMLHLKNTMQTYATTYGNRKFVQQGFLPRRAKYTPDARWYVKQAIGSMGLEFRNTGEKRWTDHLDYAHDFDADFDMLSLIKQKGYKNHTEYPIRGTQETDEAFERRVQDWKVENDKIDAENLKLDNAVLDRDWRSVFNDFVRKGVEYQAKQRVKNTIYLTLEDLKSNPAYKQSRMTGNVIRNKNNTTSHDTAYETIAQNNAYSIFQNWGRRILFNQFKKNNSMSKWADLMQNVTSAKYMIFNVTGGIANVGTGLTNIFNEVFAKDYFDGTTFAKAQAQYFGSSVKMIADMYSETTDNLDVALTKLFDIVDFDAFTERRPNETATENVRRIRDFLYSMQSGGEHYMQNTVLFAMLKSTRKFKDVDGTTRWGTYGEFTWRTERDVLMKLLADKGQNYLDDYMYFLADIKADINSLRKYDNFSRDFNQDYLRELGDKDLIKEYIAARKEALKKAEEEFKTLPTAESQFELVDGRAVIKEGSDFTGRDFGLLRQKVIEVNHKIHGIYDKIGAAKIESEWWGSLVMQYHKHIYPGIMKRWRVKGYYNELRNTVEVGSYITLAKFLSTEFRNINKKSKTKRRNAQTGELIETDSTEESREALESIRNIMKASIDTILNLKMNYQLMPEWERRNMKRCLGDLLGMSGAILAAMCLYMMTDDDDLKESELLASTLYITDRLLSEAQMYTPWGLVTEAKTLWSSPIAAQNGPKDLLKGLGIAAQWLYDDDFDINYSTGLYKGENKLAVLAYRNTPIYRVYRRLASMTKNNSYYRIDDTALNLKIAKSIADTVVPD